MSWLGMAWWSQFLSRSTSRVEFSFPTLRLFTILRSKSPVYPAIYSPIDGERIVGFMPFVKISDLRNTVLYRIWIQVAITVTLRAPLFNILQRWKNLYTGTNKFAHFFCVRTNQKSYNLKLNFTFIRRK